MKFAKLTKVSIATVALWLVRELVQLLLTLPAAGDVREERLVLADLVEDAWNAAR